MRDKVMDALIKLWVLAERLLIPRLQYQAIHKNDAIAINISEVYTKPMNYVYRNTSASSLSADYPYSTVRANWMLRSISFVPMICQRRCWLCGNFCST